MSTVQQRLFAQFKKPKSERQSKRYTTDDISKEVLEKWAADNGKTRTQMHRRKYNIKQHMLIRDAKEAREVEEAKTRADSGAGDGDGRPGTGEKASSEGPRSGARGTKRRHPKGFHITDDKSAKQAKPTEKEKKPKEQRVKQTKDKKLTVCRQLDFTTNTHGPLDHPAYISMMFDEYGGGAGVMQLMDEGVMPSGLVL